MYAQSKEQSEELWLPPDEDAGARYYKYKDEEFETRGPYRIKPLEATKSMDARLNLVFPIPGPDGNPINSQRQRRWSKTRVEKALANGGHSVSYTQYLRDEEGVTRGAKPFTVIDGIHAARKR